MPTTTNFGWTTPADTDLVKDGASAMRTLGNGIDTSLVYLKGGTTGQILSKTSNTDLAFTWINNDQGDITAVTAGTGISGGGTSGSVTITNSMATEIAAAGDIIVGTGSGTFDNLPIGTTGQVLTADTTVSPYKVKWATASSTPSFIGASAYSSTNLTVSSATNTILAFNAEEFDTNSFHDNTTNNSRLTIPSGKDGKYLVEAYVSFQANASGYRRLSLLKNGVAGLFYKTYPVQATGEETSIMVSQIFDLVATDYLQMQVYQTSGSTLTLYSGSPTASGYSWFQITYLGA